MENYRNQIYNMDCIAGMSLLPDNSVDMLLTDLPYGTTGCRWDSIIPFDQLWQQLNRVCKQNAAMVFTAAQPFTTELINSNRKSFRYCWYWHKNQVTGFPCAKHQPLRCVEDVVVFYRKMPTYNPQGLIVLDKPIRNRGKEKPQHGDSIYRMDGSLSHTTETYVTHYPRQVIEVKCERGLHPTQKPVALFEYLIRTYTEPGQLVLDCCMGSGTTKRAALNAGREYVGFELDKQHYATAINR